ncbi:hypothetical protein AYI70_g1097 [Smittium culicis]|uniref:Carbohydrate kinase PfkB domain-containing protein n=1 Tax=Smittium culicis TaxID=133412 RepID=A0A1R1YE42_9FUNG|nr:hypothetical protein AYI70_g1097 [Smittium culicis]
MLSQLKGSDSISQTAIAVCGSFIPGLDPLVVSNVLKSAFAFEESEKSILFIDSAENQFTSDIIGSSLKKLPIILKINAKELSNLTETLTCEQQDSENILLETDSNFISLDQKTKDICNNICQISNYNSVKYIAVTDGPNSAVFFDSETKLYSIIKIPDLALLIRNNDLSSSNGIINPIGAGDTCSAVFLNLLLDNSCSPLDAFLSGLSAASASCLIAAPNSIFDHESMKKILGLITHKTVFLPSSTCTSYI